MKNQKRSYVAEAPPLVGIHSTEPIFQTSNRWTYLVERQCNSMRHEVEYTNEFEQWYLGLDEDTQDSIDTAVELLEERGPNLAFPYSSGIEGSRHRHLRELRLQHKGVITIGLARELKYSSSMVIEQLIQFSPLPRKGTKTKQVKGC
jgi:Phage derived protein Gp49-like (DUF891)